MACSLGMGRKEFYHATPAEINMRYAEWVRALRLESETRVNELEYAAWLNGLHHAYAVSAALNGRKVQYPKEPLIMTKHDPKDDLTEEERKKAEQALLAASFNVRAANMRLAKHQQALQSGSG